MIDIFKEWLKDRKIKKEVKAKNQAIKREAWLYACQKTAQVFNDAYNNCKRPGTIFTGKRSTRKMYYYAKMKELGGKF